MENMITIKEGTEFCIDARELHKKLEVSRRFDHWVEHRIIKTRLKDAVDYMYLKNTTNAHIQYKLTIDAAKHICMIEDNDVGYKIRQWFIDREKELKNIKNKPLSVIERLEIELQREREIAQIKEQQATLQLQQLDTLKLAVQANEYNSGRSGYYTIRGYAKITNLKISVKEAKEIAYIARSVSKQLNLEVQKCNDERFGSVNLYHEEALKKAFDTYLTNEEHEEFLF